MYLFFYNLTFIVIIVIRAASNDYFSYWLDYFPNLSINGLVDKTLGNVKDAPHRMWVLICLVNRQTPKNIQFIIMNTKKEANFHIWEPGSIKCLEFLMEK